MRGFAWVGVSILVVAAAVPARAAADGCSRPIHVALRQGGKLIFAGPASGASGPLADFLTEIGRRSGCAIVYDPVSTARAYALVEDGATDATFAAKTPERDRHGRFVHLFTEHASLLALPGPAEGIQTLAGIQGSRLQLEVIRGFDYGPDYRALVKTLAAEGRVTEEVEPIEAAKKLAARRADAALLTPAGFMAAARDAGIADRIVATPIRDLPPVDGGLYLVRASLPPADLDHLAGTLEAAIRDGTLARILRRGMDADPTLFPGVEVAGGERQSAAD